MAASDEGHGYAKKKSSDFLFDAETLFVNQGLIHQVPVRDGSAAAAMVGDSSVPSNMSTRNETQAPLRPSPRALIPL